MLIAPSWWGIIIWANSMSAALNSCAASGEVVEPGCGVSAGVAQAPSVRVAMSAPATMRELRILIMSIANQLKGETSVNAVYDSGAHANLVAGAVSGSAD